MNAAATSLVWKGSTLDGHLLGLTDAGLKKITSRLPQQPNLKNLVKRNYRGNLQQAVARSLAQITREATYVGSVSHPNFSQKLRVFDTQDTGGRNYRILACPVSKTQSAIVSILSERNRCKSERESDSSPSGFESENAPTSKASAARKHFKPLQKGYAKQLGVDKGGQVHHAIELQVLNRYPGVFTSQELNAPANMRGIPPERQGKRQLHNAKIREFWDRHYAKLDQLIAEKRLQRGTPSYKKFVRQYLVMARDEIDYLLGQFFSENRRRLGLRTKAQRSAIGTVSRRSKTN